jgi:hypothetical protein
MFNGLKIGFYAKPNTSGGAPSEKLVMHSSKTLQECRVISKKGTIEILPTMNISELKENFRNVFGLSVDIFRKAGDATNENPLSDKLNLGEINQEYA